MNRYILYLFSLIFILGLTFGNFIQNTPIVNAGQQLENTQAERAILQAEYDQLQKEMAALEKQKESQKGQSASIDRDISILKTKIKQSQLDIKAKNLLIKKLGGEIVEKDKKINVLNTRIEDIKESLAQLIRKDREIDDKSILLLILSKDTISDAYGDIDAFSSIKKEISKSVNDIKGVRASTEVEKNKLEETKNKETDTKVQLETAKKEVEINEKDKQQLLSISKNKEVEYQKILDAKAKRRAEILAVLFNLRDVSAIPFGKALEYAKIAENKVGIRPAFLLAILTQESNLGSNQGSCYLTNIDTGAGVSSKSGKVFSNVMKASRDVKPFFEITTSVGRDPYKTLVSCPFGGSGYGGAMGPAQFIPSTWQMIKGRIASMLGISTPDPWYARDAFMASAVYLTDLGAKSSSYTSEKDAACRYYSGRPCSAPNVKNSFYGESVMKKAAEIQTTMIDPLQD